MRRIPLMLAVLLLALAIGVTACGGDDEDGNGNGGEQPAAEELETVQEGRLTVGSDIPFPPFEYREGGELTGFDVRLTEEMARRLDLEVRWVDTSFDTIFTQLAAGRFDMVASATTITEERRRQVSFTEPYYVAQQSVTVNPERTPGVQSIGDLESGSVVAVQQGTTGETWARENVPEGVDVRSFPDAPETYTALEGGNVAAVVFDEPSAVSEIEEREGLEIVQTVDTGERYGFGVNPRNDTLLSELDRVLAEIKEDGAYERIYGEFEVLPEGGNIIRAEGGEEPGGGETEPGGGATDPGGGATEPGGGATEPGGDAEGG
jgi:polar amino acid transport system substrate-binding protein